MYYETFEPHPDLQAVVKCYWVLQIPAADHEKATDLRMYFGSNEAH